MVIAQLLCNIEAAGGGGTCANLEGVSDDPTGSETPTFVGQVYQGPNTIWQSTGLTSADWTLLFDSRQLVINDATLEHFAIGGSSFISMSFPNLTDMTAFNFDGAMSIAYNTLLTSLSLPLLATIAGNLELVDLQIAAPSLPSLVSIGGALYFAESSVVTNITLPQLTTIGGLTQVRDNPNQVTFSAPNWLPTDGITIEFVGDALDAASVNHILARCVAAGVTTCSIDLSGGTNAAPSGQGILDKATLIGAGNTVVTN